MLIISCRNTLRDSDSFGQENSYFDASFAVGGRAITREIDENTVCSETEGKRVLLLVHGYNNDFDDVTKAYSVIERSIGATDEGYDAIVGFTWPGGDHKYEYHPARRRSSPAAGRLLEVMHLLSPSAIDVMSHSMGGRVVLKALTESGTEHEILRYHFATASAVDDECIEPGGRYFQATRRTHQTWIFHSKYDPVLRYWYRLGDLDTALGLHGPDDPYAVQRFCKNVKVISCRSHVTEHGGYKHCEAFYDFLQGIFQEKHPKSRQFFRL